MTCPAECAKSGAGSRGCALVTMMESTPLGDFHDATHRSRLNRSTDWHVLAQRQIRPGSVGIFKIGLQDAPQTGFIADEHMIQALALNRMSPGKRGSFVVEVNTHE